MREIGLDISGRESKDLSAFRGASFDAVVTVCGNALESCPVFPGPTRVVHRGFDDPPLLAAGAADEEEALVHYRRVRDEIREFVLGLPGSLEEARPLLKTGV
jgi:arsenate reductase